MNSRNYSRIPWAGNCIGNEGCILLVEALKSNSTLKSLYLNGDKEAKNTKDNDE